MKKYAYVTLLCALLLLVPGTDLLAQATHEITLKVNTANFDKSNPAASCAFEAGEGTIVLVANPPQDFMIQAEVGDTIRWRGVSTNQTGVSVQIRKIKYARGVNIFPQSEIDGENTVQATITKGGTRNDDYKYIISFKINDTGSMYHIDPKIRVN